MAPCLSYKDLERKLEEMIAKQIVIVGPTCTGKTSLAINLSKLFEASIVSADSRQVVRYMDFGTGKFPVSLAGRQAIRNEGYWTINDVNIYGYDLIDPDEYFSAYDFLEYCKKVVPRISREGKNVFLVGGTGFYLDVVTGKSQIAQVSPDRLLRTELEKLTTKELNEKLKALDNLAYEAIDKNNPVRLIRAIELASRAKTPDDLERTVLISKPFYIGLTANRDFLYDRADRWIDEIFTDKLFREVELIKARFPKSSRLAGLIYKSAEDCMIGTLKFENAKQRAKFDVHAYIRRQQTWFNSNKEITWFDISKKNFDADIESIVESSLNG